MFKHLVLGILGGLIGGGMLAFALLLLGSEPSDRPHVFQHVPQVYNFEDPLGAEVLARKNPQLMTLCKVVGSCAYLKVECSTIGSEVYWQVTVPSANYWEDVGYIDGFGSTLAEAANDFREKLRESKAQKAYEADHPKPAAKKHKLESCGDCS